MHPGVLLCLQHQVEVLLFHLCGKQTQHVQEVLLWPQSQSGAPTAPWHALWCHMGSRGAWKVSHVIPQLCSWPNWCQQRWSRGWCNSNSIWSRFILTGMHSSYCERRKLHVLETFLFLHETEVWIPITCIGYEQKKIKLIFFFLRVLRNLRGHCTLVSLSLSGNKQFLQWQLESQIVLWECTMQCCLNSLYAI